MQKTTPFLMFHGEAEKAIQFYIALFPNSRIVSINHYSDHEAGLAGKVIHATFSLDGQEYMAIDSRVEHGFTFTPAISIYVNCDSVGEIQYLFKQLSAGGEVLMSLDRYPFSQMFGWVNDRFGVSWQLNLA